MLGNLWNLWTHNGPYSPHRRRRLHRLALVRHLIENTDHAVLNVDVLTCVGVVLRWSWYALSATASPA